MWIRTQKNVLLNPAQIVSVVLKQDTGEGSDGAGTDLYYLLATDANGNTHELTQLVEASEVTIHFQNLATALQCREFTSSPASWLLL